MRRYFKETHVSGTVDRFTREEHQIATELEDRFGLRPGTITAEKLKQNEWTYWDLTVVEITEQEYNDPELKELCDFYSLSEFSYT